MQRPLASAPCCYIPMRARRASCCNALGAVRVEDIPLPKDKGESRVSDGDGRGRNTLGDGWIAVSNACACQLTYAIMVMCLQAGPASKVVGHSGGFIGISANLDISLDSGYIAVGMASYDQAGSAAHSRIAEVVGRVE